VSGRHIRAERRSRGAKFAPTGGEAAQQRASRSRLQAAALACVAACVLAANADAAGDAKAGRAKAQMCQACHGLDGMSQVPDAPNIAGQVEGYLVAQLTAFKSGARKNESMSLVASSLSNQDIDNLAAWYSSIEVKVGKLPNP
jgi:cytochrome c553